MEQEKANMMNEKERRERDCKNMQAELNRINTMVHNYKNMSGASNEMQYNQSFLGMSAKKNSKFVDCDDSQN